MINQTIKDILNRRSTRTFTPEMIEEGKIEMIIKSGLHAPSAHNQQSWHFTVIYNKDLIDELSIETKKILGTFPDKMLKRISENEKFHVFYHAPVVVIVSGKESALMPSEDCAAATENMLIAAESLGIGSCWVGFVKSLFESEKKESYKEKLSIPEGYKPYYGIAFGNKEDKEVKTPRRKENTVNFIY